MHDGDPQPSPRPPSAPAARRVGGSDAAGAAPAASLPPRPRRVRCAAGRVPMQVAARGSERWQRQMRAAASALRILPTGSVLGDAGRRRGFRVLDGHRRRHGCVRKNSEGGRWQEEENRRVLRRAPAEFRSRRRLESGVLSDDEVLPQQVSPSRSLIQAMRRAALMISALIVVCCSTASAEVHHEAKSFPGMTQRPIRHNATFFSPERAKIFALFSQAAYCSAPSLTAWNCTPCQQPEISGFEVSRIVSGPKSQTQAFVGSDADDIVVSFRGTDNLQNWLKDLDFPRVTSYPKCDCKVHSGFWSAWLELQADVLAEVERLVKLKPKAKIFVTGHSLGAALAALCAAELGASSHSLGYPIEGVYTYGQPRVGDNAFHSFYSTGEHVSWRITHWRDIVPHLPFESFGFHHTSTEVFYNEDNSVWKICDGSGEDDTCADQFDLALSVNDHRHYVNISITSCP